MAIEKALSVIEAEIKKHEESINELHIVHSILQGIQDADANEDANGYSYY